MPAARDSSAPGPFDPVPQGSHLRTLDGLRGIAILAVLLGHFWQMAFIKDDYLLRAFMGRVIGAAGYGVELFFVLSGFLITGILLDSRHRPGWLRTFYIRRFLRIFPLYYAALAITLLVLPRFIQLDQGARDIVAHQGWLWTYLANFPAVPVDWDASRIMIFGHFWSLCVEEHFYLVWPALVGWTRPRQLLLICGLILMMGAGVRAVPYLIHNSPALLWWSTLRKADGLAIGAIIAIMLRDPELARRVPTGRSLNILTSLLAVLFITLVSIPTRKDVPLAGVFGETIAVSLSGCMLLWALNARSTGGFHRLLNSKPLISLGVYSYGLYVIHGILRPSFQSMIPFSRLPDTRLFGFFYAILYYIPAIGVSYGLAYASYNLFEKRILALKRHFAYKHGMAVPG